MVKLAWLTPLLMSATLWAGGLHSYVNEKGIRVFTNDPPPRSVSPAPEGQSKGEEGPDWFGLIRELAPEYGVDEALVEAIIRVESAFDPWAVSPKGCLGLMQLHPDTARRFGVEDPFDPVQNLHGGMAYLRLLFEQFEGDLDLVLAAYNAGENAVLRHGGIPPYRETRQYVEKVRSLYAPPETPPLRASTLIYRIVYPDGRVLLTNTPVLDASTAGSSGSF